MKPCPFCGSSKVAVERDGGEQIYRVVCGACDAFGPPASTPVVSADKWDMRGEPSSELTATDVAAQAALNRTRNEAAQLRKQAMIRHARAIIDLYDDGGDS